MRDMMRKIGNNRRNIRRYVCIGAAAFLAAAMFVPGSGAAVSRVYAQDAADAADALLQEQRLNTWYSQAIESINEGNYENALLCISGCMTYCTKESNATLYADLYLKKGYSCLMLERYDDAIEALDEALATDPELYNAILLKASVYSETGDLDSAIEALEQYVEKSGDTSVYETIATLYEAKGETDKAYEVYGQFADASASTEAEAAYMRGLYLLQRGKYEEAVKAFDESAAAETPADGTYYNRGLCYMSLGDYPKAIEDFGKSAESESEDVAKEALYTKASCEMVTLAYDDAVTDYSACIEQDINASDSLINRGICLLLSGKNQEALEDFNGCVEDDVNADEARFYRSFVYLADKDYENALADLTTCIENGYDLANCYLQRAQVYKEMGDEEAYAADLEAAKKAQETEAEEPVEAVTEGALEDAAQAMAEEAVEAMTEGAETVPEAETEEAAAE